MFAFAQGKPEDATKYLIHSGALVKPASAALTSKQPRLCVIGMQARCSAASLARIARHAPASVLKSIVIGGGDIDRS
jgi:hypothetical protein